MEEIKFEFSCLVLTYNLLIQEVNNKFTPEKKNGCYTSENQHFAFSKGWPFIHKIGCNALNICTSGRDGKVYKHKKEQKRP